MSRSHVRPRTLASAAGTLASTSTKRAVIRESQQGTKMTPPDSSELLRGDSVTGRRCSPSPRYGQGVSTAGVTNRRTRAAFAGAAVLSALVFLGLLIDRSIVQDRFIAQEDDTAPLLKTGEDYPLSSAAVATPRLRGDFSLFEEDGVWLLQGLGYLDFRIRETSRPLSLEVGLGTLPTATRIEFKAAGLTEEVTFVLDGESTAINLEIGDEEHHTISIQCEVLGDAVDLGRDIRDLCVKLLWIRVN